MVCVFLLSACGNNNDLSNNTTDEKIVQTTTQSTENNPPKDWEPTPISDFDYNYDDRLQGVEVRYKGKSERVWFPSEINGDPVVTIGRIESDPKIIKEVYIPEGIKEIGAGAFEECLNLESVVIPEGVTIIGYSAFRECESLSSIVVPDSVTEIAGDAFYVCTSLTNFRFPSNLKSIGSSAFGAVPLTDIILPEGLEAIYYLAFMGCNEVKSIVIPSSVKIIGHGAFELCEKLAEITLANPVALLEISHDVFKDTYWYNKQPEGFVLLGDNLIAYKGEIKGTKLVIPDGTKTIADMLSAVPSNENVTEIVLPNGLKHIGTAAFREARSLKTVNIPDSVEYIRDHAFYSDFLDETAEERIRQINSLAILR